MKKLNVLFLLLAVALCSCQQDFDDNSSTANLFKGGVWMIKHVDVPSSRAVYDSTKCWAKEDTIRIKFLNGTPDLQNKVREYAAVWLQYAHLTFQYVDVTENADVKIGFDMDDKWLSWSTIGTDCKAIPQDQPSLNLFDLESDDNGHIISEIRRGFGHILGLGFEHQNPNYPPVFIPGKLADEYNLTPTEEAELIEIYTTNHTNYSAFDKNSIMTINIPRSFVTDKDYNTSRNPELSPTDIEYISLLYPEKDVEIRTDTVVKMIATDAIIQVAYKAVSDVEINWGDGTTGNDTTHIYQDGIAEHVVTIYGKTDAITELYIYGLIRTLDVSNNGALTYLYCCGGELTELDISKNKALETLTTAHQNFSTLDLSQNTALKILQTHFINLATLDVSHNTALKELCCSSNNLIGQLDLSHNPQLEFLDCYRNALSSINLSNATNLQTIYCYENRLTGLDVSKCGDLTLLDCDENDFFQNIYDAPFQSFLLSVPDRTNRPSGDICGGVNGGIGLESTFEKNWHLHHMVSHAPVATSAQVKAQQQTAYFIQKGKQLKAKLLAQKRN